MARRKAEERVSRSVSLLISLLVRYPEVGTVKYEPRQQTIRLSLLVNGELTATELESARSGLLETLEVYHLLHQRQSAVMTMVPESYGELTSISITRDVGTLTPEEVYTIVEFFRERFPGRLVAENTDFLGEDEWMAHDEMIQAMVVDLGEGRGSANLIAIREDGRVMVFQK